MATFKGPKRPENHQIGDDAKTQVMALFSSQGWVVDPTITDYGEDLDVRLTTKNELIPVRFFVQLKGTEDISKFEKTDHYSVPDLKQTTVLYWLNSEAPTILLLWDIKTKQGIYGIAKEIFSENLDANQKTITAKIPKEYFIDEHKIDSFRIDMISNYCSKRYTELMGLNSLINSNSMYEGFLGHKKDIVRQDMGKVILFYFKELGIIQYKNNDEFKISDEFEEYVKKQFEPLVKEINFEDEENFDKNIESALIEAIMGAHMLWRQTKFRLYTPGPLIDGSYFVLRELYENRLQKTLKIYKEKTN